jgi:PPOX class probable F420-dependent enzyme
MPEQRRGTAIAMTSGEVDAYLRSQRTCRVATVRQDGAPHVAPLWFVWDGGHVWLNSLVRSQRWTDLQRDPRVSLVVDSGTDFWELQGVEVTGLVEVVGDVPRSEEPDDRLSAVEREFARKYAGHETFVPDGRHAWLRVTAQKLVSWDFRKNPQLRAGVRS